MKQWLKSLFSPFSGSTAHSVCAVTAALLLTALLIFCAHSIMNTAPRDGGSLSSSDTSFADAALRADQEKITSDAAVSEVVQ